MKSERPLIWREVVVKTQSERNYMYMAWLKFQLTGAKTIYLSSLCNRPLRSVGSPRLCLPQLAVSLGWPRDGILSTIYPDRLPMNAHGRWKWHKSQRLLRPRQNGRHLADDTFKRIFLNENVRISIKISLKIVPKGPIKNIPALVLIMAWRRPGDKPLSEPMTVSLLTHICVTRPQWVKLRFRKPIKLTGDSSI